MKPRTRANLDKIFGYGALLLGIVVVVAWCAVDKSIGWYGLVALLPLLLLLGVALSAPQRW